MTIPKFLTSSADPNKLSLTVKGFLVGLIPGIIFIGAMLGVPFIEADLVQFFDLIGQFIAATLVLIGLARKIYNWIVKFYNLIKNR